MSKQNRITIYRPTILELITVFSIAVILSLVVGGMICVALYAI